MASRAERLAGGVLWNVLGRVVTMALALLALRAVVLHYGDARWGIVMLAANLSGYFALVGLGVPGGVIRAVADHHAARDVEAQRRVVAAAVAFHGAVGVAVAVLFAAAAAFADTLFRILPEDVEAARRVLLLAGVGAMVAWPVQVLGQVLQGLQEFRAHNIALMAQGLFINGAYLLMPVLALPVEAAPVALLASQLVYAGLCRRRIRQVLPGLSFAPGPVERGVLRDLMAFSIWLAAMQFSGMVISQTDQTLLALVVSTAAVTIYAIAATPMTAIREANMMVMGAVMPAVAEAARAGDRAFIESVLLRGGRVALCVIGGLIAAAAAVARPVFHAWMGPFHAAYTPVALLLLGAYAWSAIFSVPGQVLVGLGRVKALGMLSLAAAVVNLVASVILVFPYGILGVVLGTVAAYGLLAPFNVWVIFGGLGVSPWHYLGRVVAPVYGVAMALGLAFWLGAHALLGPSPAVAPTLLYAALAAAALPALTGLIVLPPADRAQALALLRRTR